MELTNTSNQLNYKNIIFEVLKMFPNYIKTDHYKYNDQSLPYSFFYGFTNYIIELINTEKDDDQVKKAFELFNHMLSSEDDKLSTLAVVEVLENLVQEEKSKRKALILLSQEGRECMQEVLKYTGIKS